MTATHTHILLTVSLEELPSDLLYLIPMSHPMSQRILQCADAYINEPVSDELYSKDILDFVADFVDVTYSIARNKRSSIEHYQFLKEHRVDFTNELTMSGCYKFVSCGEVRE